MALKPQAAQVLRILKERGSMTARDAINMQPACFRLAARVEEIRRELGASTVTMRYEYNGDTRWARYFWTPPVVASSEQVSLSL